MKTGPSPSTTTRAWTVSAFNGDGKLTTGFSPRISETLMESTCSPPVNSAHAKFCAGAQEVRVAVRIMLDKTRADFCKSSNFLVEFQTSLPAGMRIRLTAKRWPFGLFCEASFRKPFVLLARRGSKQERPHLCTRWISPCF